MSDANETITQGTLRASDGRVLPLESTDVQAAVAGPVADVVVRQRFRNTTSSPIEAVYLFPLPHEASVHRMHFRIQNRIVRAVVKEKAEARRAYERAKREGRAATLLEEDRPALFTLSVANIPPDAVIDVELAYQEVVAFDDGHFRFVFPMVAPEQYREGPAPATTGALAPPRAPTGERAPDVALSVTLRAQSAIETLRCSSHRTETRSLPGGGVEVRLPQSGPIPNRDFVLTWQASGSGVRPRVHFERRAGEPGTFLLLVTPSEPREDGRGMAQDALKALRCGNCGGTVTDMSAIKDIPGLGPVVPCKYCGAILAPGTEPVTRALQPRDVVVLVDRSASMRGSFAQVRRAALALMSSLPLGDGVQLFAFDHDRDAFDGQGKSFLSISPEVIAQADRFLQPLRPRGGTELEEALERAGRLPLREGRTRAVVLITDATIGNEGRVLRRIPELIGRSARLYVLGVGASIDRRLVGRLAQAGGGAHDVILPDEDVEVTITRFARRVREGGPILRDLGLFWEGSGMVDAHPTPVPDLFGGQPLRILGRYDGVGPTRLVITGRTVHDKPFRQEIDVDLPAQTSEIPGLARLWARQHVEALAAIVAAEPHRRDLREQALQLSLSHSIVGPYTSLVAEDEAPIAAAVKREGPDEQGRAQEKEAEKAKTESKKESEVLFSLKELVDTASVAAPELLDDEGVELDSDEEVAEGGGGELMIRSADDDAEESTRGPARRRISAPRAPSAPIPAAAPASRAARAAPSDEAEMLVMRTMVAAPAGPPPPAPGAPPPAPGFGAPPPPSAAYSGPAGLERPAPEPAAAPPPLAAPAPARPMMRTAAFSPAPAGEAAPDTGARGGEPLADVVNAPETITIESSGSEPYAEDEMRIIRERVKGELDLVFCVDATGSMGPYIAQVQRRLLALIDALRASPLCKSLRVGVVSYRDHPPQDRSYVSRALPLTDNMDAVRAEVLRLSAQGGGDGPEAVTDGLFELVRLDWRPGAAKAAVWFGDAPPHGVEPEGDGFPDGCPCGHHWFTQAESCREMGIAVYAIGCYPTLGQYAGAEEVYRRVARASRGLFLPLRDAELLVTIIGGAAVSELDRQRVDEHVADLIALVPDAFATTDEAERVRWLTAALRSRGVRPRAVHLAERRQRGAPMRFRDVEPADVEGSLHRLRAAGRF